MGRKTCEALPVQYLPNRRNIILTHNINYERAGCEIFNTVDDLLNNINDNEKVFIIGGGEIYKLFLPLANKIYLTVVNYKFENVDTYFPNINDEWELSQNTDLMIDSVSNLNFKYKTFKRK
jgi:dihydrofolate reductase